MSIPVEGPKDHAVENRHIVVNEGIAHDRRGDAPVDRRKNLAGDRTVDTVDVFRLISTDGDATVCSLLSFERHRDGLQLARYTIGIKLIGCLSGMVSRLDGHGLATGRKMRFVDAKIDFRNAAGHVQLADHPPACRVILHDVKGYLVEAGLVNDGIQFPCLVQNPVAGQISMLDFQIPERALDDKFLRRVAVKRLDPPTADTTVRPRPGIQAPGTEWIEVRRRTLVIPSVHRSGRQFFEINSRYADAIRWQGDHAAQDP